MRAIALTSIAVTIAALSCAAPLTTAAAVAKPPLSSSGARGVEDGGGIPHRCIHDEPDLQAENQRLLARAMSTGPSVQRYHAEAEAREMSAQQILGTAAPPPPGTTSASSAPIRIVFSYDDLTTSGKFCSSAGESRPTFRSGGSTTQCTSDDVLTDAKRTVLKDNIVPGAMALLQQYLLMETPVQGDLQVRSQTVCGDDFTIPAEHTSQGVASADMVVYVAAGPQSSGAAAFAGRCDADQVGRTVVGRANFFATTIVAPWSAASIAQRDSMVRIMLHEIMHTLGITAQEFFRTGRFQESTKRGKNVNIVTTGSVRSYVREWSGCASLTGAEVEDEQTDSVRGSHWERKLFKDELMSPVAGASRVSGITLGFLRDMNVGYVVEGTPGSSVMPESMRWGRGVGCGHHDNKCDTAAGGRDAYFCFDSPTSRPNKCTFDTASVGICAVFQYSGNLPEPFQYYSDATIGGASFMDGCPHVQQYSNRVCNEARDATSTESTFGHSFSATSRCFDATGVIRQGFSSSSVDGPRCLEARCPTASQVEVGVRTTSAYESCPASGAAGSTVAANNGYEGRITCPAAASMCSTLEVGAAAGTPTPGSNGGGGTTSSTSAATLPSTAAAGLAATAAVVAALVLAA